MNRILASVSAATMLAMVASAQCLNTSSPGTLIGVGDDTYFATQYPLGFAFPMANSALGSYTHFRVSCNGWLVLTDGLTTPVAGAPSAYGDVPSVLGAAGGAPRLLVFNRDLNLTAANSAGVYFDNASNPGVSCTITWKNAVDYSNTGAPKDIRAELFASGLIKYSYSASANVAGASSAFVAVSSGNGVVDPGQSDLAAAPTTTSDAVYEIFPTGAFDLNGFELMFVPTGLPGGWTVTKTCQPANHTSYGSGCYSIARDSFYQLFSDAVVASTGLTGQSISFTPAGAGYVGVWGGGSYIAPGAGAVNVFTTATDDGETTITPSIALPTPAGAQPTLRVHSNGILSWGAAAQTFPGTNNYTPTAGSLLNAANAAIYSWHDYSENETGSGRIKREEVIVGADTVLCITWDNVESWATPSVANPSTMQMQANLTTGVVTIVWQSIDTNTTSTFGSGHLVGVSAAGSSLDPGAVALATALPIATLPDVVAMSLAATPAPISNASNGTLVTYTQSNIPEAAPSSGVYLGLTILSVGQDLPGTSLAFLGMPGCNLHITSFDATFTFVGNTNSLATQFAIPAGVAYGTQIFAQSAALIAPNSLPNGQNAFGATLSNAVASFISGF